MELSQTLSYKQYMVVDASKVNSQWRSDNAAYIVDEDKNWITVDIYRPNQNDDMARAWLVKNQSVLSLEQSIPYILQGHQLTDLRTGVSQPTQISLEEIKARCNGKFGTMTYTEYFNVPRSATAPPYMGSHNLESNSYSIPLLSAVARRHQLIDTDIFTFNHITGGAGFFQITDRGSGNPVQYNFSNNPALHSGDGR